MSHNHEVRFPILYCRLLSSRSSTLSLSRDRWSVKLTTSPARRVIIGFFFIMRTGSSEKLGEKGESDKNLYFHIDIISYIRIISKL